ncbi:uncharacterized protein EV422DRAFT_333959 [Fimicolochytrium jonesii]|uniref:uncharacterized protein n=1 Tax=Fimicolochytrium jonesii TaxID=1396493 RepID=UPI0022FE4F1E|nr:uncharacterized protein EV422DRAFT_333959 [Fimicolochytrium jonesii]KAI8816114.1 hypothetical protein EV422DRAFT_333959 [Fimicolochytrium jonesii]
MINAVFSTEGAAEVLAVVFVGANSTRPFPDVLLFLSILTGVPVQTLQSHYRFFSKQQTLNAADPNLNIGPGHYVVQPNADEDPALPQLGRWANTVSLFPPRSAASSRAGPRPGSAGTVASASNPPSGVSTPRDDDTEASPEAVKRYARFTLSLGLRDRRCVVTGNADPDALEGAHIIPHSWKRQHYWGLPEDIRQTLLLDYQPLCIDDVRNGCLMEASIHAAFNMQYWSVVDEGDGRWRVVAMDKKAPSSIVGQYLRIPDPGSADNHLTYPECFVNPRFLQFHLQSAVFRRMRGAGEDDEGDYDDRDKPLGDVMKIWADEENFGRYVRSGGNVALAVE